MSQTITVLLVDEHDVARASISSILRANSDIKMLAETHKGLDAIHLAITTRPDVAVLDMAMSEPPALDVIECIHEMVPSCKVLALTLNQDDEYILPIVKAGAAGYLLKECAAKELLRAVNRLASGEVYFGQHAAKVLAARLARQ